ncbi:MAG: PEF-CTERM sorting domain-containing protein [Candidatus Hodarchaeota archaeon]
MKRNFLIYIFTLLCFYAFFAMLYTVLPSLAQVISETTSEPSPVEGPLFSDTLWILPIAVLVGVLVVLHRRKR